MNLFEYNRNAWNLQSLDGCRWSTPFSDEVIDRAKRGDWAVYGERIEELGRVLEELAGTSGGATP